MSFNRLHTAHWYRTYYGECPVCGAPKGYKKRVEGWPRPDDPAECFVRLPDHETYDFCVERDVPEQVA